MAKKFTKKVRDLILRLGKRYNTLYHNEEFHKLYEKASCELEKELDRKIAKNKENGLIKPLTDEEIEQLVNEAIEEADKTDVTKKKKVKVSFEFEFPEYRYDYRRNPHVMMETLLEKELTQIMTEYLCGDYEVNGNKITNLNIEE